MSKNKLTDREIEVLQHANHMLRTQYREQLVLVCEGPQTKAADRDQVRFSRLIARSLKIDSKLQGMLSKEGKKKNHRHGMTSPPASRRPWQNEK